MGDRIGRGAPDYETPERLSRLVGAFAVENHEHGFEKDLHLHPQAPLLDVLNIQLHSLGIIHIAAA